MDTTQEIFSNLIHIKPINLNEFNKKSFILPLAIFLSLVFDPERVINNYNFNSNDNQNNKMILCEFSKQFTTKLYYYTNNLYVSIIMILLSIAFFSFSNTFIYFRF